MKLRHIVLESTRLDGQNCAYEIDENRRILRQRTLEGKGWQKVEQPAFVIGSAEMHPEITNHCQAETFTRDLVDGYKPVTIYDSGPRLEAFDIKEVKFVDEEEEE